MAEQKVDAEQAIEATGEDIEDAVETGLARLGVDRAAVEVEVLDEGSRGLFGLGGREVRVRLTVKPADASAREEVVPAGPPEPATPPPAKPAEHAVLSPDEQEEAELAQGVMRDLLTLMGMDRARVEVRRAEPARGEESPPLVLDVEGPEADLLIGRRGDTLAALQRITRLIIGREMEDRVHLVVDVNGFKARREESLQRLALRLADQAIRTNRTVVMEPMPPHERRYVHLALRDHPHVTTQSIGEGDRRKVTIIPHKEPLSSR
jgi:spoIIIJ-associated protein